MASYEMDYYRSERYSFEHIDLRPPLKLLPEWNMRGLCHYPLPRIAHGMVFTTDRKGRVRSLNESTGAMLWDYQISDFQWSGKNFWNGESIVLGRNLLIRNDPILLIIDCYSGKVILQIEIPQVVLYKAVVNERNIILSDSKKVGNDYQRRIFCFDLMTCETKWEFLADYTGDMNSRFTATKHSIYTTEMTGDRECIVKSLDWQTGYVKWQTSIEDLGKYQEVGEVLRGSIEGSLIAFPNTLVVPIRESCVAGMDIKTGRIKWTQKLKMKLTSSLCGYPDGRVYLASGGYYYCIDGESGEVIQEAYSRKTIEMGLNCIVRLSVSEDFVYLSDINRGILGAMNKQTGDVEWTFKCKGPIREDNAPILANGRLYIVDSLGNFYVFQGA